MTQAATILTRAVPEWREALGLSQSRLARFSGLSRRMLAGLEAAEPSDVGGSRVPHLLSVLGLDIDLDPPSQAAQSRKRGLWMAAKNASVACVREMSSEALGHALVSGSVSQGCAAHLTHRHDESPRCRRW